MWVVRMPLKNLILKKVAQYLPLDLQKNFCFSRNALWFALEDLARDFNAAFTQEVASLRSMIRPAPAIVTDELKDGIIWTAGN